MFKTGNRALVLILLLVFSVCVHADWSQPKIPEDKNIIGHIFRSSRGHFEIDSKENRSFIEAATEKPGNKVGVNSFGQDIYIKTMSDGTQAWAEVRGNEIRNGGKNNFPKKWVSDPSSANGGYFITPKFTFYRKCTESFKSSLVLNHIKAVYEAACQTPKYTPLIERKIQGVAGNYGRITNLLDSPGENGPHTFYIPGYELGETEALQILRDVARGIYIYEDLPFFSLHFNKSLVSYPVIPSVF